MPSPSFPLCIDCTALLHTYRTPTQDHISIAVPLHQCFSLQILASIISQTLLPPLYQCLIFFPEDQKPTGLPPGYLCLALYIFESRYFFIGSFGRQIAEAFVKGTQAGISIPWLSTELAFTNTSSGRVILTPRTPQLVSQWLSKIEPGILILNQVSI